MSIKLKLFKDASTFFWGETLIMLSGIISFPILTRIFSKEEYGLFSLIGATIAILMMICSLGTNRSMLRFYEKYRQQDLTYTFISTLFIAVLVFGLFVLLVAILAGKFIFFDWSVIQYAFLPFVLAVLWMIAQNLFTLLNIVFRLEDKIVLYNINGIIRKYGALILSISLILLFHGLTSYYVGVLVVEGLAIIILIILVKRLLHPIMRGQKLLSKEILVTSMIYGFPLALSALPSMIFNTADRYVIAHFFSAQEVAIYSVGGTLCLYMKELIISPVNLSLIPTMFGLWEKGNIDGIRDILKLVIRCILMFAIPICFVTFLISEDLISILASDKYLRSAEIMPIILMGIFIQGLEFPFSAGLHFVNRTGLFLSVMTFAALLNVGLNIILVSQYGIMGAAFSNLTSSCTYVSLLYFLSQRHFKVAIPYVKIVLYLIVSGICFICIQWYSSVIIIPIKILNILNISIAFFALYLFLLYFIDRDMKTALGRIKNLILKK